MTGRFSQIIGNMRGLIKDESWSASSGYLVAVSGGMDSMCLASLFLEVCGPEAFAVAHCNFHLRGTESDEDEALVRRWADSNGVRVHRVDFDTEENARSKGISIEMAARDLRYGWFASLCRDYGYNAVAVAHNANDNAETLMLNLLRGTGVKGLSGMAPVSPVPAAGCGSGSGTPLLLRPLLGFTRKQIEGYVFANSIPYRNDSTNALSDYKRNRLRNEVFPVFEKINPSFIRTLNREIGYFAEAAAIVGDWADEAMSSITDFSSAEDGVVCRVNLAQLLGNSHWRYLLYSMLEPYGFSSSVLASIEDLLESGRTLSGKRFDSPTHILMTGRDGLTVLDREVAAKVTDMSEADVMVVRGQGTYNFNGVRWKVEVLDWDHSSSLKQEAGTLVMDASQLPFPFVCRKWRKGDWFIPLGMKGRKKISDLFADLKYDALAKSTSLMIVDCRAEYADIQRVAGLLGVRVDDRCKVTDKTEKVIRIKILNNR